MEDLRKGSYSSYGLSLISDQDLENEDSQHQCHLDKGWASLKYRWKAPRPITMNYRCLYNYSGCYKRACKPRGVEHRCQDGAFFRVREFSQHGRPRDNAKHNSKPKDHSSDDVHSSFGTCQYSHSLQTVVVVTHCLVRKLEGLLPLIRRRCQ